jgi:hypothetical protein
MRSICLRMAIGHRRIPIQSCNMSPKMASGLIIGLARAVVARVGPHPSRWAFDAERNQRADAHWAAVSDLARLSGPRPPVRGVAR